MIYHKNEIIEYLNISSRIIIIIIYAAYSRAMVLWMITCISSLCSIDKLSFPSFPSFYFSLYLPISSYVSQIIKEL
jgi:hypothetical protein